MDAWLTALIHPLMVESFTLWGAPVSRLELLGFVTGGLCVALTVRRNVLNFPVGIANCVFFLLLFASSRLWADAGLQIVYIALGVAGWVRWTRGRRGDTALVVTRAPAREIRWCLAFVVVGTAVVYVALRHADGAAPLFDALTTCLSLAAQWLLNGKRIQTWYFWIAADCIYIPLYVVKDLNLTALVYVLFLGLCIAGLRSWRRAMADDAAPTLERVAS